MTKQEQLKNKIYKLLSKQPYNTVRTETERISRQLRYVDNKVEK